MKQWGACPECGFTMRPETFGLDAFTNHCPRCLRTKMMWGRLLTAEELTKLIERFQGEADRFQVLADMRTEVLEKLQKEMKQCQSSE